MTAELQQMIYKKMSNYVCEEASFFSFFLFPLPTAKFTLLPGCAALGVKFTLGHFEDF